MIPDLIQGFLPKLKPHAPMTTKPMLDLPIPEVPKKTPEKHAPKRANYNQKIKPWYK